MLKENREIKFNVITEHPGQKASREQLERLYHRYHFARGFVDGGIVLEVGCGSGVGLGYLAEVAKSVIGGDIDQYNVEVASEYYANNPLVSIDTIDAQRMPYEEDVIDIILCFETIYYLKNPEIFIDEASRVLKNGGALIISTVNKDWKDFHPSLYSHRYFSVPELDDLLFVQYAVSSLLSAGRFYESCRINFNNVTGNPKIIYSPD